MAQAERVATTVAQGVHGRRRVGTGETFWQFRRYQPGDSATAIDWRQSAKSQRVFVRENEWEAAQSVWLWRDGSASMRFRSGLARTDKLERASLLLLALVSLLVRGGERVALLGSGERPTTGRAAVTRLALNLIRRDGDAMAAESASLPEPEHLPRFSQVVLVGDFLAPLEQLEKTILGFAGDGVSGHLLQILDPAEQELPYQGRTQFEGMENEGDITVGRIEELRGDYVRVMTARRERLTSLARRLGWTFAVHLSDRPPETALLALYRAIAGDLAQSAW